MHLKDAKEMSKAGKWGNFPGGVCSQGPGLQGDMHLMCLSNKVRPEWLEGREQGRDEEVTELPRG